MTSASLKITLPYPPSVNNMYRRTHWGGTALTDRAQRYKHSAAVIVMAEWGSRRTITGPVRVVITLHPPDRRRRDVDNTSKMICDALERGGVVANDSQIAPLVIDRGEPCKDGMVVVEIGIPGEAAG
ncbi:MAG: RusA family crossover junction endodeoxyribonuclease [Phycisphaeraceae bacterium]|nr:MAG: RusA family crossover junction endodeoxyribonuclease [Phycisphaeraceae bacterium]